MVQMKTLFEIGFLKKTSALLVLVLAPFAFSICAQASDLCEGLKNKPGLYLVRPQGRTIRLSKTITRAQPAREGELVYVSETAGSNGEAVTHLRIMTVAIDTQKNKPLEEITLSRNKNTSICDKSTWLERLFAFGEQREKVGKYDAFKDDQIGVASTALSTWHFEWNNGGRSLKTCAHTAKYVPYIAGKRRGYASGATLAATLANPAQADELYYLKLPRAKAATMVLIHQPKDGSACHTIKLPSKADLRSSVTRIDMLRLAKEKYFHPIHRHTIIWSAE
jgi:hypothetical protein